MLQELTVFGDSQALVDTDVHVLGHGRISFLRARRLGDGLRAPILCGQAEPRVGVTSHLRAFASSGGATWRSVRYCSRGVVILCARGTLVLVFDRRRRACQFDLLRYFTAREAVNDYDTVVGRVTAKTVRTITVGPCVLPTGYWSSCDLQTFSEPKDDAQARTMRFAVPRRQIGHLGALDELRRRVAMHGDFTEWRSGYAASKLAQQADDEARRARQLAERDRQRPLCAATERLAQLVDADLVSWGGPMVGEAIVAKALRELGRLRTYVAGLNATGAISDQEYAEAQEQLAVVIGH